MLTTLSKFRSQILLITATLAIAAQAKAPKKASTNPKPAAPASTPTSAPAADKYLALYPLEKAEFIFDDVPAVEDANERSLIAQQSRLLSLISLVRYGGSTMQSEEVDGQLKITDLDDKFATNEVIPVSLTGVNLQSVSFVTVPTETGNYSIYSRERVGKKDFVVTPIARAEIERGKIIEHWGADGAVPGMNDRWLFVSHTSFTGYLVVDATSGEPTEGFDNATLESVMGNETPNRAPIVRIRGTSQKLSFAQRTQFIAVLKKLLAKSLRAHGAELDKLYTQPRSQDKLNENLKNLHTGAAPMMAEGLQAAAANEAERLLSQSTDLFTTAESEAMRAQLRDFARKHLEIRKAIAYQPGHY